MDHNKEKDLEFHKFEYEFVNQKLNLNVARLDKLWVALGGSVFLSVASSLKTQELRVMLIFLPIIVSLWLTLFLYVIGQIERQKIIAMNHAKNINRLLGKDILIYDLGIMRNLWRFDRRIPSFSMILFYTVLIIPSLAIFSFTIFEGFYFLKEKVGRVGAWLYIAVCTSILVVGILSFLWARLKRTQYQISNDAPKESTN